MGLGDIEIVAYTPDVTFEPAAPLRQRSAGACVQYGRRWLGAGLGRASVGAGVVVDTLVSRTVPGSADPLSDIR